MADFSLTRSTSIGDPSSGPPQQQLTIEPSPPTPAPGDADVGEDAANVRPEAVFTDARALIPGCAAAAGLAVGSSKSLRIQRGLVDSWTRGSLAFESTSPR